MAQSEVAEVNRLVDFLRVWKNGEVIGVVNCGVPDKTGWKYHNSPPDPI